MARLTASVGEGGKNLAPDVKYVQALLVDWLLVRKREPLAIDGICGPLTKAAILDFQRAETRVSDGRVDPGGSTIAQLESRHIANLAAPLWGVAHYAIISPMRPSLAPLDVNALAERYLSTLRKSFG